MRKRAIEDDNCTVNLKSGTERKKKETEDQWPCRL